MRMGPFFLVFSFCKLRKCIATAGLEAKEYGSHSFRIGAATEAAIWGLSPEIVKRIGHWDSGHYRLYVCPHFL